MLSIKGTITFQVGLWAAQHLSKVVLTIDCASRVNFGGVESLNNKFYASNEI